MALRVAEEWLSICAGCEVSILDIGEDLVGLLPALEFVHMPEPSFLTVSLKFKFSKCPHLILHST